MKLGPRLILSQWRIQDFPQGGRQLPKMLLFFNFLPKTAWKWKNLDPQWGGARPWCPPWIRQWIKLLSIVIFCSLLQTRFDHLSIKSFCMHLPLFEIISNAVTIQWEILWLFWNFYHGGQNGSDGNGIFEVWILRARDRDRDILARLRFGHQRPLNRRCPDEKYPYVNNNRLTEYPGTPAWTPATSKSRVSNERKKSYFFPFFHLFAK